MAERRCPICRRPTVERYRPFCSRRCSDVDLNRWLSDAYRVPGPPEDDDEAERPRPRDAEEGGA